MPAYGPADIYHLSMGHPDGSQCQHSFKDEAKRWRAPIASDETRSLPILECNKGCMEWALEPRNGWKQRPEQVAFTQNEIDNELTLSQDSRSGMKLIGEAMAAAMKQQVALSDGVDVRKAPTRARRTHR